MEIFKGKKRNTPWPFFKPTPKQDFARKADQEENEESQLEPVQDDSKPANTQQLEEQFLEDEEVPVVEQVETKNYEQFLTETTSPVTDAKQVTANEEMLQEAIRLHDLGAAGDKKAVEEAYELLKKLRHLEPDNEIVEGYYGSVRSLMGRDAINPTERFNQTLKGLKILDQVVKKHPENVQLRILRANVCFRIPEMYFHRTETAIEDFNYLVSLFEQDNTIFSENYYWQLLYDLGTAYKNVNKNQEAQETWSRLLAVTSDGQYIKLLKQEGIKLPKKVEEDDVVEKVKVDDEFIVSQEEKDVKQEKIFSKGDIGEEFLEEQDELETAQAEDKEDIVEISEASVLNDESVIKEGIELHAAALKGDKEATRKAYDYFNKAHKNYPDNDLITAYYADCLSMTGRDSIVPTSMFGNAIKAMKILDELVNNNPDNMKIRFIRAYQSFRLPEAFFKRTATAIGDFEYLLQQYNEGVNLFTQDIYWKLLYDLGTAYQRLDMEEDAKDVWFRLLAATSDPQYKTLINEQVANPENVSANMVSLNTKEELLAEGIRLHDLGVAGNTQAVKLAHQILAKAYELDPEDAMVLGYYGSTIALVGRDSTEADQMFGNAIKGLKFLKEAIKRDNTNPQLRLLRAYVFNSLPQSFFPLKEKAIKDFKFVKNAYELANSGISQDLYHQVLYALGTAYQETGNSKKAEKTWKTLVAQSDDPKYQGLVDIEL